MNGKIVLSVDSFIKNTIHTKPQVITNQIHRKTQCNKGHTNYFPKFYFPLETCFVGNYIFTLHQQNEKTMIDFCSIKEIQKALTDLEENLKLEYGIGINEAAVLCSLSDCCLTSSEISKCADLRASHTSKTIRVVEDKGLIKRKIGKSDKRLMRFSLTKTGKALLTQMSQEKITIPALLKPLVEKKATVTLKL